MSYKRAWELVADINESFAEPLVAAQTGGKAGGGARADAARRGADAPLPRDRAQGAVGYGLPSQGPAGDFPQQAAEIIAILGGNGEVRRGAEQRSAKACRASRSTRQSSPRRVRRRFYDPAFAPLEQRDRARSSTSPGTATPSSRKAPHTKPAGKGYADPDYELSVEWIGAQRARSASRASAEIEVGEVAHPADQRLLAQRPDLSGRNVQDLPAGEDRRARCSSASAASRSSCSTSAGSPRSTAAHPSLQGLRLDSHAALPLAVLLLSQPCAGADATTG